MKYELIRTVTQQECSWLDKDYEKGDEVFRYHGYTYGCVTGDGTACCEKKDETPFFELPTNALKEIES